MAIRPERYSIYHWLKKYNTLKQKKWGMSKKDEIKKLKERIEEPKFVKDSNKMALPIWNTSQGFI
jgi:hypothetical protein